MGSAVGTILASLTGMRAGIQESQEEADRLGHTADELLERMQRLGFDDKIRQAADLQERTDELAGLGPRIDLIIWVGPR